MISGVKSKNEKKKAALSYWSKDKCMCPVCRKEFPKEVMYSGNGRMIAGGLTDELHRLFEPSKKFGRIFPLVYDIGACPICYTAFFWYDFKDVKDPNLIDDLYNKSEERKHKVEVLFPYFDLTRMRTIYDGAAMYYLALLTYSSAGAEMLPTIKSAILTIRLAWICDELNTRCPGHNFDYVAQVFYRKALFFYQQAIEVETSRVEQSSSILNSGPDMDKNYGWDGVIYLSGLLEYRYGQKDDLALRYKKLSVSKTAIARLFGLGKSSKSKPGPLLEHARNLYDLISKEVKEEEEI